MLENVYYTFSFFLILRVEIRIHGEKINELRLELNGYLTSDLLDTQDFLHSKEIKSKFIHDCSFEWS